MTDPRPAPPYWSEPHDSGLLPVGDGQHVYWEVCGNPRGKPALAVHGGPGSGCHPGWRRPLYPERYRLVLFDQRGCGRSTPHAGDPATDMRHNTTHHLIADMERLRGRLGIERRLLSRAWPDAELRVVDGAGHLGDDATRRQVHTALDRFARA